MLCRVSKRTPHSHFGPKSVSHRGSAAYSKYRRETCFNLCALQIRRDVRNAIQRGVSIVLFSNAEELNGEHHLSASIYFRNGLRLVCVNCVRLNRVRTLVARTLGSPASPKK